MGGRLNLDGGTLNLDGGTLNLDGGTLNLDGGTQTLNGETRPPPPPYNLSTAYRHNQTFDLQPKTYCFGIDKHACFEDFYHW